MAERNAEMKAGTKFDQGGPCSALYYAGSNDLRFNLLAFSLIIPICINFYVRAERNYVRQLSLGKPKTRCDGCKAYLFSKNVVLPVYDYVLWLSVVTAAIRAILDVINARTSNFRWDASQWYFWLFWGFGLQGSRQFLGSVVAFLLVQRSSGQAAFRRAIVGASLMLLTTGLLAGALITACEEHKISMSLFLTLDSLTTFVYLVIFAYILCWRLRRWRALYFYLSFQIAVNTLYVFGSSMMVSTGIASSVDLCVWTTGDLMVIILQPFAILFTLRDDSRYWRSLATVVGASGTRGGTEVFEGTLRFSRRKGFTEVGEFLAMEIKLLDFSKLELFEGLGSGSSASVFRAAYGSREVAIKSLDFEELTGGVVKQFCQEAILSYRLSHKNVVRFLGVCLRPPELFLAFEFCRGGSLRRLLDGPMPLPKSTRIQLALDCAEGMAFLHKCRIVHRDLKSSNILIQEDPHDGGLIAKIADFGLSRILLPQPPPSGNTGDRPTYHERKGENYERKGESTCTMGTSTSLLPSHLPGAPSIHVEDYSFDAKASTDDSNAKDLEWSLNAPLISRAKNGKSRKNSWVPQPKHELTTAIGTVEYLAPELLTELQFKESKFGGVAVASNTVPYGYEVDVYAFAIVLWEIATRRQPYSGVRTAKDVQQIVLAGLRLRLPLEKKISDRYSQLINNCWQENPDRRPCFSEIAEKLRNIMYHDVSVDDDDVSRGGTAVRGDTQLRVQREQKDTLATDQTPGIEDLMQTSMGDPVADRLLTKKEKAMIKKRLI
mmetsp:Transcript_18775/g.28131  ORF Transcript_18775/g.28131 Transcript_18775/m.28131 type:complete len:775 (+) Transcript_18775:109-2433(+)